MKKDRVDIEDLEIGDIVFVNNKHGYCEVMDIGFSFYGGKVALTFKHTELWRGNQLFTGLYPFSKTFRLYE